MTAARPGVRPAVRLRRPVGRAIARGHPWIYDQALGDVGLAPGTVATLVDHGQRDRAVAVVFVDPRGPIRARVLDRDPAAAVDDAWVEARVARAAGHRRLGPELADTDALRLVHGENDGLAGLVVDLYAGVAVVAFDGVAAAALWRPRLAAVVRGLAAAGWPVTSGWIRAVRGGDQPAGPLDHRAPPERVAIHEGPARFDVDVRAGQKTGFFLDQRANRARVAELAGGARVLNLFAYTGGFSVLAGLAGAAHVTSVDLAGPAVAAAGAHWRANGLPADRHDGVTADAFDFLERAAAAGRRWDVVVVDPPSFAPSAAVRERALAAYLRLERLALAVTAPGGVLVAASCSSHVTEADLRDVLARAGRTGRTETTTVRIVEARGAAADHPTLPGFPEGRYLKCLIAGVDREHGPQVR